MKVGFRFCFILFSAIFTANCSQSKFDVDVSDVDVTIDIKRLDRDLFAINPDSTEKKLPLLFDKYGEFFELYSYKIIALGNPYSPVYPEYLNSFITDYTMNQVQEKVQEKYSDIAPLKAELEEAFRHYKYYFPEEKYEVPQVYTYISGFNQSVVTADSMLGIALDKYLGADCEFYARLGWDRYKRRKMTPEKIITDCMWAWGNMEFPYQPETDNMLAQMIHNGKLHYFLDAVCPAQPDTIKFGYTLQQYTWAEEYEKNVYDYLIEKKLLFTTDQNEIRRYIRDAPFTTTFSNNSAPRTGVWIGWKIVHAYMEQNPEIPLKQLMENNNYQQIFNEAKYQPE